MYLLRVNPKDKRKTKKSYYYLLTEERAKDLRYQATRRLLESSGYDIVNWKEWGVIQDAANGDFRWK